MPHLLLLILQSPGDAYVMLNQLVLLHVGVVEVLDCGERRVQLAAKPTITHLVGTDASSLSGGKRAIKVITCIPETLFPLKLLLSFTKWFILEWVKIHISRMFQCFPASFKTKQSVFH